MAINGLKMLLCFEKENLQHIYIYIHICVCVYIYIYIHVRVCVYIQIDNPEIYIYKYVYISQSISFRIFLRKYSSGMSKPPSAAGTSFPFSFPFFVCPSLASFFHLSFSSSLIWFREGIGLIPSPLYSSCGVEPHTTVHVFSCSLHSTPLTEMNMWDERFVRPLLAPSFHICFRIGV